MKQYQFPSWASVALIVVLLSGGSLLAQVPLLDTLANHSAVQQLYLPRSENPGQWGYTLGINSNYRQQYAEKYYIRGASRVHGIVVHLGGRFRNPNNMVEAAVFNVASNGLPGTKRAGRQVFYRDLDLSGSAFYIRFGSPVSVSDSFHISINFGDYAHGGFDGDTLGLYACLPGCRREDDLPVFGRNAVQWHNHSRVDWRDFYTQNFTPFAIHVAIYPVVDRIQPSSVIARKEYGGHQRSVASNSLRSKPGDGLLLRFRGLHDAAGRKRRR